MKITYLKLTNYRCFGQIELSLHPELTVIVGANGAGKSSLLDSLIVALGSYLSKFDESEGNGFKQQDAHRLVSSTNSFEMISQYPICVEAIGEWQYPSLSAELDALKGTGLPSREQTHLEISPSSPHELLLHSKTASFVNVQEGLRFQSWAQNAWYWRRELMGPKKNTTIKDSALLAKYGDWSQRTLRTSPDIILPVLGYYGTGRLWSLQKLTESAKHVLSASRTMGYRECLNPASSFKEFAYWFKQLSIAITNTIDLESQGIDSHHGERLRELRSAVVDAINACLEQSDWCNLYYDAAEDQIQVKHNDGGVMPVALLSDGVRSVLALAADIAFRCCKLNGHLGTEAVKLTPGIVMIDELDLHLHPSWQQTIVPAFQKAFPQIQFIITTHSPHLLSTVPSECIRILQDGQILQPHIETEGEQSRAVLEDVFGVSAWPPMQIAAKLKDYLRLVDHQEYDTLEGKALRAELEDHYGKGHVELAMADIVIMRYEALKQARQSRA